MESLAGKWLLSYWSAVWKRGKVSGPFFDTFSLSKGRSQCKRQNYPSNGLLAQGKVSGAFS